MADLAHAMHQQLVGCGRVGPNRLDKLALGHQAAGILDEITQDLEALRTQLHIAIRDLQRTARHVQSMPYELESRRHQAQFPFFWRVVPEVELQPSYSLCQANYRVLSGLRTQLRGQL